MSIAQMHLKNITEQTPRQRRSRNSRSPLGRPSPVVESPLLAVAPEHRAGPPGLQVSRARPWIRFRQTLACPTPPAPSWRSVALLVASAFFMENVAGTIISRAAPRMAHSGGVHAVQINVAITAYLLTPGILIGVSGWGAGFTA